MNSEPAAFDISRLRILLQPLGPKIASLILRSDRYGHKATLHFLNDYGVEIFKHLDDDFFEMTVIRFRGLSYEFAFDTTIPDLNLGYSEEDVLKLCGEISKLK